MAECSSNCFSGTGDANISFGTSGNSTIISNSECIGPVYAQAYWRSATGLDQSFAQRGLYSLGPFPTFPAPEYAPSENGASRIYSWVAQDITQSAKDKYWDSILLNPGNGRFPVLSGIAKRFQRFKWLGLSFEFRTETSKSGVGEPTPLPIPSNVPWLSLTSPIYKYFPAANTPSVTYGAGMGSVTMVTQYNTSQRLPLSQEEALQWHGTTSGVIHESQVHHVECAAPATNPLDLMYVWRGEAQDDDDKLNTKFYFPGRFSLFCQNASGVNGGGVLAAYRPPLDGQNWPQNAFFLGALTIPTTPAPLDAVGKLEPGTSFSYGYVTNDIIGKLYVHYSVQLVGAISYDPNQSNRFLSQCRVNAPIAVAGFPYVAFSNSVGFQNPGTVIRGIPLSIIGPNKLMLRADSMSCEPPGTRLLITLTIVGFVPPDDVMGLPSELALTNCLLSNYFAYPRVAGSFYGSKCRGMIATTGLSPNNGGTAILSTYTLMACFTVPDPGYDSIIEFKWGANNLDQDRVIPQPTASIPIYSCNIEGMFVDPSDGSMFPVTATVSASGGGYPLVPDALGSTNPHGGVLPGLSEGVRVVSAGTFDVLSASQIASKKGRY